MPLCFNLFGELFLDDARASRSATKLWGTERGSACRVHFEWSPGRRDPQVLGDRTAFDAAFEIDDQDRGRTVVGVETKCHEKPALDPPSFGLNARYAEVSRRSKVFKSGAAEKIGGSHLQQIWRDHLLILSMLQHPSKTWSHGLYVLVHPAWNTAFAALAEEYLDLLDDPASFRSATIEDLVGADVLHATDTRQKFMARYFLDPVRG